MVRLKVILTRLVILSLAGVVGWMTFPVWSQWLVKRQLAQWFGSAVEFDQARFDWRSGQLDLTNFQVPDPGVPLRNLIQAERVSLQLESKSLLGETVQFATAEARGVVVGSPRERLAGDQFNGALSLAPRGLTAPQVPEMADVAKGWLDQLQSAPPAPPAGIETLQAQLSQLHQTWKEEFARQLEQINRLNQQLNERLEWIRTSGENPLRAEETGPTQAAVLQKLQQDFVVCRAWLDSWQETHQPAVEKLARLRTQIESEISPIQFGSAARQALGPLLISPHDLQTSEQLTGWAVELHRHWKAIQTANTWPLQRGNDHVLRGHSPQPDVGIRQFRFDGSLRIGDQHVPFGGVLSDLTNRPGLAVSPIHCQLVGQGPLPFRIDAKLDPLSPNNGEEFRICLPAREMPAASLGTANSILLGLSPHRQQTDAVLRVDGETVSGTVTCTHSQVGLFCDQLNPLAGGDGVQDKLNSRLATISNFVVVATVSGTIDQPRLEFRSDLAEPCQLAVEECFNQLVQEQHVQAVSQAGPILAAGLSALQQLAREQLQELDQALSGNAPRWAELERLGPSGGLRKIR